MKPECLKDEEIASYVDGTADAGLRQKVENHIADCSVCLHSVAELKHLVNAYESSPVRTPEALLARAREMADRAARKSAGPLHGFSIVATLSETLVKIIETTGSLLPPPRLSPVPARKRRRRGLVPRVAKSLSGHLVTVELRAVEEQIAADISLLDETTSERPDGVKVKLLSGETVETRYTRSGKASFAVLPAGISELDLEGIGRIMLDIRQPS
jgi:anti-sigma factor RsiW